MPTTITTCQLLTTGTRKQPFAIALTCTATMTCLPVETVQTRIQGMVTAATSKGDTRASVTRAAMRP